MEGMRETAGISSPGEANKHKDDGRDGERAQRCEHCVGGATRAAKPLMNERETGCRERNEKDTEKADGKIHSAAFCRER